MGLLQLREYERIRCGTAFDPRSRTVTPAQQRALERLSERYRRTRGARVFANGPGGSLSAQQFVGVVDLGLHQVEILPKIDGTDGAVRTRLRRMIAEAWQLDLHVQGPTATGRTHDTVLETMIRLFCDRLWVAVRQGIVRRYQPQAENLTVLRGRIDIARQVRHNLARPDRLHCRFDEFTEDHALNQALKAALRVLSTVARAESTSRAVTELLFCFADVEDVAPASLDWRAAGVDRLSRRYGPLLRLARLFLEGASPDVVSGGGDGFALLFDMNELFETYVGRQAMRALKPLGFTVSLQRPRRMFTLDDDGDGAFELRPDIVVSDASGPRVILDTKWKRLQDGAGRESVSSADLYQMHAYASRYGVDEVVLLYPHHAGLGPWTARRAAYRTMDASGHARGRVVVATVDLSELATVEKGLLQTLLASADRIGLPVDAPGGCTSLSYPDRA